MACLGIRGENQRPHATLTQSLPVMPCAPPYCSTILLHIFILYIHHLSTFQKRDSLDSKILSQNYWNSNQIRDCVRNKFHQDLCTFSAKFLRQQIRFCKIFNLLILECMFSRNRSQRTEICNAEQNIFKRTYCKLDF